METKTHGSLLPNFSPRSLTRPVWTSVAMTTQLLPNGTSGSPASVSWAVMQISSGCLAASWIAPDRPVSVLPADWITWESTHSSLRPRVWPIRLHKRLNNGGNGLELPRQHCFLSAMVFPAVFLPSACVFPRFESSAFSARSIRVCVFGRH